MLHFARERGEPIFSFEFFPPKTEAGIESLFASLKALRPLAPSYVSVPYGAGGSTRGRTQEIVTRIKRDTEIEAMAHLTCVGATRAELKTQLEGLADAGVRNILALRGDPPRGQQFFVPTDGGLRFASELVQLAREVGEEKKFDFCIGAACYP